MKYTCSKCHYLYYALGEQIDHYLFWEFKSLCPKCNTANSWYLKKCFIINKLPPWLVRYLLNFLLMQVIIYLRKQFPWLDKLLPKKLTVEEVLAVNFWEAILPVIFQALMGTQAYKDAVATIVKQAEGIIPNAIEPFIGQFLEDIGKGIKA